MVLFSSVVSDNEEHELREAAARRGGNDLPESG